MKKLLHPAVGLWLVFSLICGLIVGKSQFTADMSAFLPRDPSPRQKILIDQISEGFASRALIVGLEGAPAPVLTQMSQTLGKLLRQESDFSSVTNGQSDLGKKDQELLFGQRYLLSPNVTPERMTAQGLRSAVKDSLAEVASSTGLFSKSLLGRDPTGESLEVIKKVIPTNQPAQSDGVWMNSAQNRALILLQTKAQGSDLDGQQKAHTMIEKSFVQAKAQMGSLADQVTLKFSGPSVFAVSARDTIKSEAARLSAIGTFLVLCLLWFIYRSVTTLFLGILPVATGALAGVAAVGLGFPSVHGMTLGFGITLIGEAVDYAIYLFVQYAPKASHSVEAATTKDQDAFAASFWPTIRLGVLTSIFGFSTMLLSGFTGLAQLGLFSIAGIVAAAITTRFVLPVLLPRGFTVRQPISLGPMLAKTTLALHRLRIPALILTALALTVIGVRWSNLWSTELGGLSPVPEAAQKLDADLRADLGAPDAGVLVVMKADSSEKALQLSESVATKLQQLVVAGQLSGFQAPSHYLPSQRTQKLRQAALPDDQILQSRMALALEGLPLKVDKLSEYFAEVALAKKSKPLERADLEGTSLSLGVDALLMKTGGMVDPWTALMTLEAPTQNGTQASIDIGVVNNAIFSSDQLDPKNVFVVEIKNEAKDVYRNYLHEAIILSAAGFIAIIVLLWIVLRSLRRMLQVIMPLLAAAAVTAACVVIFKTQLSLLHLIGLLLVVAIGSNYALFFDRRSSEKASVDGDDHNMLCSLLFANLTTVLGFGLLAFSSVPVMNAIGLTVGLGTFLALIMSAVFSSQPPAYVLARE
jgi:predicted exporter